MVKIVLPESLLLLGELKNATNDMIAELKDDKETKAVGKRIETGLKNAPILAEKESVQKFAEVLQRTLKKDTDGKIASAIITTLLLTD